LLERDTTLVYSN